MIVKNTIMISSTVVESFLHGSNPKKYVVSIEPTYNNPFVYLIINDPVRGKYIEEHPFEPFIWFKKDILSVLYGGKQLLQIEAAKKFGVKTKRLKTSDSNGFIPERMENGYKYLAICNKNYNSLISFFKEGGVDIFNPSFSKMFIAFTQVEQFMIQSGIRLFNGYDDYNQLHRLQFDLETEGLVGTKDAIFQIGVKDNRGFEEVLQVVGDNAQQRRDSEREIIINFFQIIHRIQPDIIAGYNSEGFDWKFLVDRCERLNIPIEKIAICLDGSNRFKRRPSMLKLGNETESFDQTYMFGYNIIDIAHSVRRAQAINSNIKEWGLKYITKYSNVAKVNRVYVPGDKIHTTWKDTVNQYALNMNNGDWYKISKDMPIMVDYDVVSGENIVVRYLLDDLWETEKIDNIFNQALFLISKLLPTTFSRCSTMGTATQWKLIMSAWSYENNLAIPDTEPKRNFTGGLSRLLELGYAKNVAKEDYAALYPKTQLTHGIFPDLDISGVMEGLLTYIVDTRDKFKFLTVKHEEITNDLDKKIKSGEYTGVELDELKLKHSENLSLAGLYDKKQLPLKILANSWFGAYGAPYIFNWGDTNCAEETTCRGRQYLRLMVKFFKEKYGFRPLVLDTDGCNFAIPDNINDIKYRALGSHWKTKENTNVELVGLDAVLAEFNETYMFGRMGLDTDNICDATINFSRKNYANMINGKIKFVGNSIKSKKMPVYIEEFLTLGLKLLLNGKGKEFITEYHNYVDRIYNYNIPLVKIASKARVKSDISSYKLRTSKKNKAGNPMPKQAHMELAIRSGLNVNLGDTLYYINTGSSKSASDLKSVKDKDGTVTVLLNSKLIDVDVITKNLDTIREIESLNKVLATSDEINAIKIKNDIINHESTLLKDDYNVAKYLESFNKKIKPLLICFDSSIRNKIILSITKDKKTKLEKLSTRSIFTDEQCVLVSGQADKEGDQDSYEEDLMKMEDKEIKFWIRVDKVPNNMTLNEWTEIKDEYIIREKFEHEIGVINEKRHIDDIFMSLELPDYELIKKNILPSSITSFATIDEHDYFTSIKYGDQLCPVLDIFKYSNLAIERDNWYHENNITSENKYDEWLSIVEPDRKIPKENTSPIVSDDEDDEDHDEIINDEIEIIEDILYDNENEFYLDKIPVDESEWNF